MKTSNKKNKIKRLKIDYREMYNEQYAISRKLMGDLNTLECKVDLVNTLADIGGGLDLNDATDALKAWNLFLAIEQLINSKAPVGDLLAAWPEDEDG